MLKCWGSAHGEALGLQLSKLGLTTEDILHHGAWLRPDFKPPSHALLRWRGCRWCTNAACCRAFQDHLPELREWREEMRSLSKERHNAEVLLIFAPRLPSALNAPRPPPPAARESNRSATSEVSCCTSQESCGSDACREDLIPDRKTKVPPAERPESDSAASCLTSPSGSASSCSTKSSCSTSPSKPAPQSPKTSKRLKVKKCQKAGHQAISVSKK